MTLLIRLLIAATLVATPVVATPVVAQPLRPQIDSWRRAHEREILDEAFALLALPNVASDTANIALNVAFLTEAFARRGVTLSALRAPTGGSPALFGEIRARGAARTVVFYAHYDGQPVAGGGWDGAPFTPELRHYTNSVATDAVPLPARGATVDPEARIRARSASDDKGPIIAMLAALDAMTAAKKTPSGTGSLLRDDGWIQARIAQSEARLQSARAWIVTILRVMWRECRAGQPGFESRVQLRLASTYAITEARDVVHAAYADAGATAIFESQPFERRLRDMNAVSQQIQGNFTHLQSVGQYYLGLKPGTRFI